MWFICKVSFFEISILNSNNNNGKNGKPKKKDYFLVAVYFFLGLIVFCFICDKWLLPWTIHSGDSVKVPYLVGKNINNATQLLIDHHLDLEKVYEQYSEKVPANQVINQVPKPGLYVKEGRNIYLTISKGRETVAMPYLIGQSLKTARRTLQTSGLLMGEITYETNESYGKDTVITQSFNSNSRVIYGQKINVVVSSGSYYQVSMPYLVGASYDDAMITLAESGLSVIKIDTVDNDTFLPNTIVSQLPVAGETLKMRRLAS